MRRSHGGYGAGCREDTGRVMAPRQRYSGGPQGYASGIEENADALPAAEGSRPGHERASVQDPTGVCERGRYAQG